MPIDWTLDFMGGTPPEDKRGPVLLAFKSKEIFTLPLIFAWVPHGRLAELKVLAEGDPVRVTGTLGSISVGQGINIENAEITIIRE